MQVFRKRSNYIWRNIHLKKSQILLFITIFFLSFMLFIMNKFPYASVGLILIPLAYILGIYTYQKYILWDSGATGENSIEKELKRLDDKYYMINGAVIPPNRGDTDYIILGTNGIFVIESKNYGGEISCDGDVWGRYKIGKRGSRYELYIGSPSNQVKRNAKVLKDFMLEHRNKIFNENIPHLWINGIVVFTNKNANLDIKNPTVEILKIDELYDFIKNKRDVKFSIKEIENIKNLILKYSG